MEGAPADFKGKKIIALFDVDQTLTPARQSIQPDMLETYKACAAAGVHMGIVSGSDIVKVTEQVGQEMVDSSIYCFSENGLLAMKHGKEFARQSFKDHLGEDNLKRLINFALRYIADLDIPIKRYVIICIFMFIVDIYIEVLS
jgi:phosphomannomutase